MSKRILFAVMFVSSLFLGGVIAQEAPDLNTFQPRESSITFEYPSTWIAREDGRVVALGSDESVFPAELNQSLDSGQFKILLVYLTPNQREQLDINGSTLNSILQSVVEDSNIPITTEGIRQYEFNRRLTIRTDFVNDGNQGAIWVMEMPDEAIVLLQAITAPDEMALFDGQIIDLLRSLELGTITRQLYAIQDLDRPLRFSPQKTRLVFDYPEGWTVREPNANTVVLDAPRVQISLQFFDYTDLSLEGSPIDDPTSILQTRQSRSERPEVFSDIQQVTINGQRLPYSTIQGDGFAGLSLGRDIKIGFLWVTVLTADDNIPDDLGTLAWALLLTTTYRPDRVELTERVIMPRHQFEFHYPAGWLTREVSPSAYLIGTSEAMIDNNPDNLQFTGDAQMLIQYVSPEEYGVARAGTDSAIEVLQKFISSTSDLTTYETPRTIALGDFEFAQVDFDNPGYSGTALLTPMGDGGAVWIQLRTPPAELGDWEPIALAIARNSRIVRFGESASGTLDDAVFDALNVEPTPIPTPTRRPDAPPDLEDVLSDVIATPAPPIVRELNFELPPLTSTYTTNISNMTARYPAGWVVQEIFPASDASPTFENSIHMSNNANLLLSDQAEVQEGDVEVIVQYIRYDEMNALGFRGDNLFDVIQSVLSIFPDRTFETPLRFRINGELMILISSTTESRQSVSIHKELSDEGYVTAQLIISPSELGLWLPTTIAIIQSVQVP